MALNDAPIAAYEPPIYEKRATTYLTEKVPEKWPGVRVAPFGLNRNVWVHAYDPGFGRYIAGKSSAQQRVANLLKKLAPEKLARIPLQRPIGGQGRQGIQQLRPSRGIPQPNRNTADLSGEYTDTDDVQFIEVDLFAPAAATSLLAESVPIGFEHRIVEINLFSNGFGGTTGQTYTLKHSS
jgi:hypothetical protein